LLSPGTLSCVPVVLLSHMSSFTVFIYACPWDWRDLPLLSVVCYASTAFTLQTCTCCQLWIGCQGEVQLIGVLLTPTYYFGRTSKRFLLPLHVRYPKRSNAQQCVVMRRTRGRSRSRTAGLHEMIMGVLSVLYLGGFASAWH